MITVAGISPSLDLTYLVDALQLGQIQRSSSVVSCAGGKPLNAARAAATLGADVAVVAILGGATGDLIERALLAAGLTLISVPTPNETRTCVSIAAADSGQLTEVYQNAARVPGPVWTRFAHALGEQLTDRPGWLLVNGGAPLGLDAAAIAGLVGMGHHRGVRVAVDTYGVSLEQAIQVRPAVVKVNRAEASALLGADPEADLLEVATELQQRTGELVVLTDGRDGAVAVDDEHRLRVHLPDRVGHYPVGSGDSFLAGLVTALDRGDDLPTALTLAAAAGVANALVPGPGVFSADEAADLFAQISVTAA